MPSPSQALTTLRPDLGSMVEFDTQADREGYVAARVFPQIDVATAGDTFGRVPVEELLREADARRTPKGGYAEDEFEFEEDSYATKEHGFTSKVDENLARKYRRFFDAELIATERARSKTLMGAEKRVANQVFDATNYTGAALTTVITHEWDDLVNAVPIDNVEAAVQKVYDNCGLKANALIINWKVYRNLRRCEQILEVMKSQNFQDVRAKFLGASALAEVFDLPNIIVAGGTRNSASEGQAATFSQIWSGEYASVARIAESNDIEEPCLGRTFHWTEDGSEFDGHVESYWSDEHRCWKYRVRRQTHEKRMYLQCAHLLSNITT